MRLFGQTTAGYFEGRLGLLLASDLPQARRILASADWALLQEKLFNYVKNYSYKIVPARTGFQF